MKSFKWKIGLEFVKDEKVDVVQIVTDHITAAMRYAYKDGLSWDCQRRLVKILDKIETDKTGTVKLEDAEFDLLKESFKRAKFPPATTRVLNKIYDAIEEADTKAKKDG